MLLLDRLFALTIARMKELSTKEIRALDGEDSASLRLRDGRQTATKWRLYVICQTANGSSIFHEQYLRALYALQTAITASKGSSALLLATLLCSQYELTHAGYSSFCLQQDGACMEPFSVLPYFFGSSSVRSHCSLTFRTSELTFPRSCPIRKL